MKEKKEYTAKEIKSLQTKLNDLKENHGKFSTKLEQDKINSFNLPIEEPINYYDGFNTGFDTDSSPFVWEHYRKYYNLQLKNPNQINDTHFYFYYLRYTKLQNVYRLHAAPIDIYKKSRQGKNHCCRANGKYPTLSGDTDFNFNPKHFTSAFLNEISTETKALLNSCRNMHHTLTNFSLMLSTGNMQGFKGLICDDRLDRFIYFLERYYTESDKQNTHIASFATENNRPALINYLNSFEGVYDYCQKIYFISDKKLIEKLINSGKQPITGAKDKKGNAISPEQRIIEYMDLAIEFWDAKAKYFANPENIVKKPEN